MSIILFILSLVILLICFFYNNKKLKEIKEEQNKTAEEIWEKEKEKYKEEIEAYWREKQARQEQNQKEIFQSQQIINQYEQRKNYLVKEIEEKQNFNNSLLQIREAELDRLIQEKKIEKEKALDSHLKLEEERRLLLLNSQFIQFTTEQDKEKERILKELDKVRNELEDFRLQREAVNQAILREKELQEKETFYKIDISENDREDIYLLKSISPQIKNKEALNKLIYDVFVKRPLTELIKRITGGRAVSGIYKITYIKTGEAYIGRTTDIQTRWQNHIKTACGLEGAARTTFHNRLEKDGIWNYTFEILEEAPKEKLSEREKFYIDLYRTDTQLNSKRGG